MPENGDAIWGVNTNAIVADVVLAVDEQQTDIDGLRQTVADLQTQIAQLSQQIQVLSQPAAQS
jgi:cell division protein FtsB